MAENWQLSTGGLILTPGGCKLAANVKAEIEALRQQMVAGTEERLA